MNHRSQPKSRLASVTFARELPCLDRAGSMVNITSQWQDPEILISCDKSISRKNRSHAEAPCAQSSFWYWYPPVSGISPKSWSCPRPRSWRVPAKLKPIVVELNCYYFAMPIACGKSAVASKNDCSVCTVCFIVSSEIGYDFKLFQCLEIREELQNSGKQPITGSKLCTDSFCWARVDATELKQQSRTVLTDKWPVIELSTAPLDFLFGGGGGAWSGPVPAFGYIFASFLRINPYI